MIKIEPYANLQGANLRDANLQGANLRDADLRGANLRGADLQDADLRGADLRDADLRGVNLQGTDLRGANLRDANLRRADLRDADLLGANLRGADLRDANLPAFQICPTEGDFTAWKKTISGAIKIQIPASAKRTSSLIGRKCRAEFVVTLETPTGKPMKSRHDQETGYTPGMTTYPDAYDGDIRIECTNGIHFFMTKEEADNY
jgi:hypothetical protein